MEAAVIQLLLNAAGVTGQVSTRVYPVARPQGSALPAVTVHRIDGGPEYAADGEVGLTNGRVQIDCYGRTYNAAKSAADACKAALSAVRDTTILTIDVRYIMVVFERDTRETGAKADEYLFRRQIDVDVWTGG